MTSVWMVTLLVVLLSVATAAAVVPTAVTITGGVGPTFDGVGGASGGGGGTRLLIDYPGPQQSDILDMLFKPLHGASLQHIKVEVGCDGDTTQGSEPTHARSPTDVNFDRGYEVWLMQEAVKRRPGIQLSGLEWGIPGWVAAAGGGMWGETNVEYLTGWVTGLRDQKGLNITSLGVAYNERAYNASFIKAMRRSLDSAGLRHVQTIAPDSWGAMWAIVADMQKDPVLAAAVDVIGTHCPGYINGIPGSSHQPPPGTMELGKPLWSTEQHIGERGLIGNAPAPFDADLPVWDFRAALGVARILNQGYLTANQTSTLFWTPVWSWYEHLLYGGKGLVVANTPWSGWWETPDAVWMVAHTTQFVQPGWRFTDSAGTTLMGDGQGSVVSYLSANGADLSIVIETAQSNVANTVNIQLSRQFSLLENLHMWRSEKGAVFVQQAPLRLHASKATLVLPPGVVITLTTTTGQTKGRPASPVPKASNFSLPHSDDFEGYHEDSLPRFSSDMHGVFTTQHVPGVPI